MRYIISFIAGIVFAVFAVGAHAVFTNQNLNLILPEGASLPARDVGVNEWFAGAVNRATSRGIMSLDSGMMFRPGQNINRAQMAVIMDKFSDYSNRLAIPNKMFEMRMAMDFLKRYYQEINGMLTNTTAQNRTAECTHIASYRGDFLLQYSYFFNLKQDLERLGYEFNSNNIVNEITSSYSDVRMNEHFTQVCGT